MSRVGGKTRNRMKVDWLIAGAGLLDARWRNGSQHKHEPKAHNRAAAARKKKTPG